MRLVRTDGTNASGGPDRLDVVETHEVAVAQARELLAVAREEVIEMKL